MRRIILAFIFLGLAHAAPVASDAEVQAEDHRAWQHGIDVVRVGDRLLVVWGSSGNPPRPNLGGDWHHDVYYAWLDIEAAQQFTQISPRTLVSKPEAQEPPSVAVNSRGTILMTCEDGNGGINQHAGMWDSSLRVLRKYPITIKRGGHSGHVAAMGDRFLAAYSEGWEEGGGFLDLGTGKNIYARIVTNNGKPGHEIKIVSDSDPNHRDGWPLVAGSDRNWLVVWQRYPALTLQAALISRSGDVVARRQVVDGLPLRYAYDVEFAPQIESYIVAGSSGDGGFVSLLSLTGEIVKTRQGLPPMASESRIILGWDGAHLIGTYPVRPHGIAVVRISTSAVELVKVIDHSYIWDYSGTTGMFVAPGRVLFLTLSTTGLHLIHVDL
jgi:hypothetical protein